MDAATNEKLMADLRAVVRDAEGLLQAAAAESGERLGEVGEDAREAARAIDAEVRKHPWAAVGIAAGVGLVLGLLIGRK